MADGATSVTYHAVHDFERHDAIARIMAALGSVPFDKRLDRVLGTILRAVRPLALSLRLAIAFSNGGSH